MIFTIPAFQHTEIAQFAKYNGSSSECVHAIQHYMMTNMESSSAEAEECCDAISNSLIAVSDNTSADMMNHLVTALSKVYHRPLIDADIVVRLVNVINRSTTKRIHIGAVFALCSVLTSCNCLDADEVCDLLEDADAGKALDKLWKSYPQDRNVLASLYKCMRSTREDREREAMRMARNLLQGEKKPKAKKKQKKKKHPTFIKKEEEEKEDEEEEDPKPGFREEVIPAPLPPPLPPPPSIWNDDNALSDEELFLAGIVFDFYEGDFLDVSKSIKRMRKDFLIQII